MSSILDALNKAEEERAAQEDALARGFDNLDIEEELTGRLASNAARNPDVSLTPFKVLVLGFVFLAVVAAASGAGALVVFHLRNNSSVAQSKGDSAESNHHLAAISPTVPDPGPQTTARPALSSLPVASNASETTISETAAPSAPAVPIASEPVEQPVPAAGAEPTSGTEVSAHRVSPVEPAGEEVLAPAPEPAAPAPAPWEDMSEAVPDAPPPAREAPPVEPAAAPRVQMAAAEPVRPVFVAPAPVQPAAPPELEAPEPAAEPAPREYASAVTSRPAEVAAPASAPAEAPAASRKVSEGEVDIMSLPELTASDRHRLKLPEITVNVVGRPSKYRPQPSAMINFSRVVLNDLIPGTRAQLIGVSVHGIGIQVGDERYFVPK